MRTRNGRRKVLSGTNYPMIFHDPTLADLDALAFADEARELYLSANAQRLFEEGPRRLLCLGERERAGRRVWCPQRTSCRSGPGRIGGSRNPISKRKSTRCVADGTPRR